MSTNIDTLTIQIESSSNNAAKGIRDLSMALGELKKNGSVNVAVKNLEKLSGALKGFTASTNATQAVGKLVGALTRLKEVGSIASVANSITKLSSGLNALEHVNLENAAVKIQRIATAVAPLSSIKAGGIGTMVNALGRIGKVTESLNDEKITAFAERITKLTEKLGPLSEKMTTIQAGLKAVNTNARNAGNATRQMGEDVNATALNLSSFIHIIQAAVGAIQRAVQAFSNFTAQAIEWDGIASRFGRGFGTQAKDTYDWIQKLNEEMGINTQQFMQYSSIYSTMLTGFGVASEDAAKMALGYTELTYDIWAGYNDVYKNFADAAEAVKSAIAGEVEPIRRAGFTIIESTLEQTAANYGLEISLANATEAQKSYLRYLTLMDQAHAQNLVGTYAKELNTAEGLMRTFSQQLKSLTQAFGSLFLPILVKVMPYLQAFVELLTEAVHWIAGLFGITIQGVDWSGYKEGAGAIGGVADSAGDATDALGSAAKAAKELKNATLGIDELNVISPPSASGGAGGGGAGGGIGGNGFDGLDVDSLWDDSVFANIGNQIDKIKEKLEAWFPIIKTVAALFAGLGIALLIAQLGEGMAALAEMEGLVGVLKRTLAALTILSIEAVLVFMLSDEYLESGNLLALIGQALTTATGGYLMYKGFGTKGLVASLGISLAMQLLAITMNLADGGVEMDDPQLWIQAAMATLTAAAGGMFAFKGVANVGKGKGALIGATLGMSLSLAAITMGEVAANKEVTTASILTGLGSVLSAAGFGFTVGGPWGAVIGAAVGLGINVIGAAVASIAANAKKDLEKDLEEHFGSIELSTNDVKLIVEKLSPEWAEGVKLAVELYADVDSLKASIERQVNALNVYEWQVAVGIGLTPEEQKKYKAAIDDFVSLCQQYITDRGYALEVGLKATGADGSIIESANAISKAASTELDRLGKELQEKVNSAYEDGLLDIDELEAIQNIRNDMLEIQNALSSSNIEAEFSMLEMKWSGVDLDPESYKELMGEWEDVIQNEVKPALESTVKENLRTLEGNVAFAKMQLAKNPGDEEAKQMLIDAENALQAYIKENPLENLTIEANIRAINFGLNTIQDLYEAEIKKAMDHVYYDYDYSIGEILDLNKVFIGEEDGKKVYDGLNSIITGLHSRLGQAKFELSKESRKAIEAMLEEMEPTMADIEKVAEANRKAGTTVTQSVRDGLNDYNELLALSGSQDGISYRIGQGFSTDRAFLDTLALVEKSGSKITGKIREGLLNNLDYVKDSASGLIIGIKDSVTGETIPVTKTLKKNLEDMGVSMGDALGSKYDYVYDETTGVLESIVDSVNGNEVWVNKELKTAGETAGKDLSNGLKEGVDKNKPGLFSKIRSWAGGVLDAIKDRFDTHSPSKETKKIGKDLSDGLYQGMSLTAIRDKLSKMWSTAKTWWNNSKGTLKTYTPSIGSIKDKLSSSWSTARNWWNRNKGTMSTYTPSIGSIKDKLSSAWKTAKTWWSNNVRLSIPSLSFKIAYSEPSGFQKPIVKALGLSGWPKLSFAANGGIFDMGSLIWAGERGAEVVANAGGGKTGVMNVQQMQDAVYEGVYAAVVAAMRTGGGNGNGQGVNVYLDGKQIYSSVKRTEAEKGMSLMGNQLGYNY